MEKYTFGITNLSFVAGLNEPTLNGTEISAPKAWREKLLALSESQFLIPTLEGEGWFGGTDESSFLTLTDRYSVNALMENGVDGFYNYLKPPIISNLEKAYDRSARRQGDIFAFPLELTVENLLDLMKSAPDLQDIFKNTAEDRTYANLAQHIRKEEIAVRYGDHILFYDGASIFNGYYHEYHSIPVRHILRGTLIFTPHDYQPALGFEIIFKAATNKLHSQVIDAVLKSEKDSYGIDRPKFGHGTLIAPDHADLVLDKLHLFVRRMGRELLVPRQFAD